jgi:RHH-type transcriptional regulator, proline utilization regulon repressor / proline dehydrogenase / delta 1-pyrroline-5-carboxylate dehydrogenase
MPPLPLDELVADPVTAVEALAASEGQLGLPHPRIPLPRELYGTKRINSSGLDLSNEQRLASLSSALLTSATQPWRAEPIIDAELDQGVEQPVINPAEPGDVVGYVREATEGEVSRALDAAAAAGPIWFATPPSERAAILERAAELMEGQLQSLLGILVREAGKTFNNAIAEVREAVDFLHYYAGQVRDDFANDSHRPLGPVVCISPWNFPLAIFTGQIAAALAAGNSVLAKPAEQTPLIAAQAVRILLEAGIPQGVLQLLPGQGESVGSVLVNDARVRGVMFTGSTDVAGILQRSIAGRLDPQGRPTPLIAETGGLNAMIVDSSALTEQVVTDVVASAFDSAGQRCSALRILCIQEDVAEHTLQMLRGAMAECRMGNPERLSTDIGPVIDAEAKTGIERHIQAMRAKGRKVYQAAKGNVQDEKEWSRGTFIKPTLIELDSFDELQKEIFGPVLHVVRFQRTNLESLVDQINAAGYGLTLGVHTRIDETIARVTEQRKRWATCTLTATWWAPWSACSHSVAKACPAPGLRPVDRCTCTACWLAVQTMRCKPHAGTARTMSKTSAGSHRYGQPVAGKAHQALLAMGALQEKNTAIWRALAQELGRTGRRAAPSAPLPGPTGERNTYALLPRERVLCLFDNEQDALTQLAAVLAVGSRVQWIDSEVQRALYRRLPKAVQQQINVAKSWDAEGVEFDAVIYHGDSDQLRSLCEKIAERPGAIVSVQGFSHGETGILLERLLLERSLSVNTAAAGGNASLMTIG